MLLGRIIEKKYPDLLADIMPMIKPQKKAINQQDLDTIAAIYQWFIANITDTLYQHESENMKNTLFCALIMKIYSPDVFDTPVRVKMRDNLRLSLALVLGKKEQSVITHICSNIRTYIKAYQSFRDTLDYFYDTYTNQSDGSKGTQ